MNEKVKVSVEEYHVFVLNLRDKYDKLMREYQEQLEIKQLREIQDYFDRHLVLSDKS